MSVCVSPNLGEQLPAKDRGSAGQEGREADNEAGQTAELRDNGN